MVMYREYFKRIIDFTVASIALALLSPIILAGTLFLGIANQGKPFFFQLRPGKNEQLFKIVKFKTMNDKKDDEGNLLPDAKRLTKIGVFVRKTSLDELPQLLNVLKGDMSLIGPRPLLVEYLPFYTSEENVRHLVRPGITGLAQVNGRNTVCWDERLAFDIKYVEEITFLNDVSIIIQSIKAVLLLKNVNVDPTSIMKDLNEERKNTSI